MQKLPTLCAASGAQQAKTIPRAFGHCTFGKASRKQPDSKGCENYILGSSPEEAFATKEYLSKELLQYMLQLELLPEIEEKG